MNDLEAKINSLTAERWVGYYGSSSYHNISMLAMGFAARHFISLCPCMFFRWVSIHNLLSMGGLSGCHLFQAFRALFTMDITKKRDDK